ncbi:hypothetical protein ACR79S_19310 [Sphingobacterium spiritivorum]|uniref:hypothetical protein n=1 Tax=Sphingobacterium spiritivorum TaxID=258 RepID=UPI003DA3F051
MATGGTVATVETGTVIGAPAAWIVGESIVAGGLIGGGAVAAYDYFFEPKNSSLLSVDESKQIDEKDYLNGGKE